MPRGQAIDLPIPSAGTRYDQPAYAVTSPYCYDSINVLSQHGALVPRPGLVKLFATGFGEHVAGGIYYRLNDQSERMVAAGLTKWQRANFVTAAWVDITGTPPTGTADDQWRMIAWPEGGNTYAIGVNNVDTPKEWDGNAATYSTLTGLSQWTTAKDLTIVANRILAFNIVQSGVRYPSRLIFGDFNTRSTWTGTNIIDLSDTNDAIVAGRALNRTAFAVLKDNSQWVGQAQTGTFAFRVELQDTQVGPASPSAVIERFGILYYLSQDGTFYAFDGTRALHIGEQIRKKVQSTLNYNRLARAHGVYRAIDRTFWWFFPTTGDNPTAAVSFRALTNTEGEWRYHELSSSLVATASWPYKFASTFSWDTLPAEWTWDTISTDYPSWDVFPQTSQPEEVIASTNHIWRFTSSGHDDNNAVASQWETSYPFTPGVRSRVDAYETRFQRTASVVTATVSIGSTETYAAAPTYPVALQASFDLSTDARKVLDASQNAGGTGTGTAEAQFLSVKHQLSATIPWEYRGSVIHTQPALVE